MGEIPVSWNKNVKEADKFGLELLIAMVLICRQKVRSTPHTLAKNEPRGWNMKHRRKAFTQLEKQLAV